MKNTTMLLWKIIIESCTYTEKNEIFLLSYFAILPKILKINLLGFKHFDMHIPIDIGIQLLILCYFMLILWRKKSVDCKRYTKTIYTYFYYAISFFGFKFLLVIEAIVTSWNFIDKCIQYFSNAILFIFCQIMLQKVN